MKKSLITLLKVVLWLGFFINLGVIELFRSLSEKDEGSTVYIYGVKVHRLHLSREQEGRFSGQMFAWEQRKKEAVLAKIAHGSEYSVASYFADLKEFADSCRLVGSTPVGMSMMNLQALSVCHRYDNIDSIRAVYFPEMAAAEKAAAKDAPSWDQIGKQITLWSTGWYIKSLPLALLLFLIWLYEDNQYNRIRFRNPVSFIISLLLYPIVIGYNIARWWKHTRGEIEVRRTKDKIFHLLANDEVALLKEFVDKSRSVKWLRHELGKRGHVPQHTCFAVALAMLILSVVPVAAVSRTRVIVVEQVVRDSTHCAIHGTSNSPPHYQYDAVAEYEAPLVIAVKRVTRIFLEYISSSPCDGHYRGLDPVPLFVTNYCITYL